MGQVEPEVVASAFGVFKPEVVVAGVRFGWPRTDAPTIFAARRAGAVAQLERVCGPAGTEIDARGLAARTRRRPARGAGPPALLRICAPQWDDPADPWTRLFHLGDMLREYRGDAHVCAWSTAGVDAVEIGLLTELVHGPSAAYVHTDARGWNDGELDAARGAAARPRAGSTTAEALTETGRAEREAMERATDRSMTPRDRGAGRRRRRAGRTAHEPWGDAMRAAGGYVGGPVDLWPNRA